MFRFHCVVTLARSGLLHGREARWGYNSHMTSRKRIGIFGWGVVAQQPASSSMGLAARDAQLRQLLMGYGLILLLGVAAIFLTAQITATRRRADAELLRNRIVFENLFE